MNQTNLRIRIVIIEEYTDISTATNPCSFFYIFLQTDE